jgi:NAD-dependent dihydropyrimidine dehydrogenase PreA subunit
LLIWISLIPILWWGGFAWRAYAQGSRRAAWRGLTVAVVLALLLAVLLRLPGWAQLAALIGLAGIMGLGGLLLLWPVGILPPTIERPSSRYDERDMVFARRRLTPGTERHTDYYARHPEKREADAAWAELPGLMSHRAPAAHPWAFAAAAASFQFTGDIRDLVDGAHVAPDPELAEQARAVSQGEMTHWLKALARFYGAQSAGICALQPYHLYSHIGRGAGPYGAPVALDHDYALAFTVEMRDPLVQQGPGAGAIMESAKEYAEAAHIALQLTNFIRLLGYRARAHIDGNYRVICPLVARDAGLGEIGRLSYLITPELGPRVRLAVVTTDLPLDTDPYEPDMAVIDMCTACAKCVDTCPARAIPDGPRQAVEGALRWKIDADACFRYWNRAGTDCARCMATCPYSHAELYDLPGVRWALRRSGLARRAFLWLDDWLYGRRPPPRSSPDLG